MSTNAASPPVADNTEPESESDPVLRAFPITFGGFTRLLNAIGTSLVFVIMAFATADIAGRLLFNLPLAGVPELVTMSIVGIVFLQLPHAVGSGRLIRSDMLMGALQVKAPRAEAALSAFFDLIGAGVFGSILLGTIPHLFDAYRFGYEFGTPGIFVFPQWPLRLIVVIGCATTIIQFSLHLLQKLKYAVTGSRQTANLAEEK